MANRKYTQNLRIKKSYEAYRRNVQSLSEKYSTSAPVSHEKYKDFYLKASAAGKKNIARDYAFNVNVVTTGKEARDLYNRIKEAYGADETFSEDFYSARELRNLSGQEKWQYLKDLGFDDKEAGLLYDNEVEVVDKKTGQTRRASYEG